MCSASGMMGDDWWVKFVGPEVDASRVERWGRDGTDLREVAECIAHAAPLEAARRVQELLLQEHFDARRAVQMR